MRMRFIAADYRCIWLRLLLMVVMIRGVSGKDLLQAASAFFSFQLSFSIFSSVSIAACFFLRALCSLHRIEPFLLSAGCCTRSVYLDIIELLEHCI